nr:hypothetical protein [Tanacetum cinerariifolium]
MSDSDESGVTYTDISSPFEELSNVGSPRADDHEHLELPEMLEDPYVESMLMMGLLLRINRMLRMLHLLLSHLSDDEDDDMDIEVDEEEEEEEHPAPADSVVVASTTTDKAPSIVRLLAMSSLPASPLSPWSSPPPHIPFLPLPPILSPPSPVLSPAPPPSPIRSLGYRAAMIRLRVEAASTSHSPPLPSPFILSPTRSYASSSGTPLLLPISASTLSPPLQLLSASRREDKPEVSLPPRKRLGITFGPGYEVRESSSAAAARPARGLRADYGFVATMDREIMRDPEREVGYGITDSWDEIVEALQGAPVSTDTELDDEQSERQLLAGRLNTLFKNRRAHAYTRHLMETESRMSREAWVRSTDASDLVRGEVMSLRTTVLGQMTEIRELHAVAVDRMRQTVISEMLRADHKRSTEIIELRTALQGQVTALQGQVIALQAHVTALQGQQGFAGGPTQPELLEEAGSGS